MKCKNKRWINIIINRSEKDIKSKNKMKKSMYVIGLTALLLAGFSACKKSTSESQTVCSENSLEGTYKGLIPSAGGEGINVEITLNSDKTYQLSYQYIGKDDTPFLSSGKFTVDEDDIITLDSDSPSYYLIDENTLTQLDLDKKIIEGEFAEMYVLSKE